ncbi:amidohydrolase [Carnobacterium funditum]|uniref:amidohydrolase n=1 Tax=Carnobacterium funditum TaxID=2752 RepID=UPI00054DE985|nr:amidohydrolase [Carnobacterium funditum]
MVWIKNVYLETGYEEVSPKKFITTTAEFALEVENGEIKTISQKKQENNRDTIDAKGYLALPSLQDNHIHLDKGYFGGEWQAVVPASGVVERIQEEKGFLKDFLPETPKKAQALIDLICDKGATFLRVQTNVDSVIGLDNMACIKKVLEENKHRLDYEMVVFPQHGTLITEEQGLLRSALASDDKFILGGLDPATIDGDIEKSLHTTFTLASHYYREIDYHLHDRGTLGLFEIKRIIDYTKKYQLEGKVQISHALALADGDEQTIQMIAKRLAEAEIGINTTIPIDTTVLPILLLQENGVKVRVVNDNINDHWSPFGSGDLIERASRAAEVFSMKDERSLAQAYSLVSNGRTPLNKKGQQQWPKIGDQADFLFTKAASSAHLIARICPERVVMFKGKLVSGKFD